MPYDEGRQKRENQVGRDADGAVQVSQSDIDVYGEAMARYGVVPVMRHGLALEHCNEKVGKASDNDKERRRIDDPFMLRDDDYA